MTDLLKPQQGPGPAEDDKKRLRNWAWMAFVLAMGAGRVAFHFYDTGALFKLPAPQAPGAEARDLVKTGDQQISDGKFAVAVSTFGMAIRRDPDYAPAYAERALAHYWNEDYKQAKIDADRAGSMDQSNPVPDRVYGLLSLRDHRYGDAQASFTHALKLAPGDAFTYFHRARAYAQDKQPDLARADAETAVRLQPDLPGPYDLLAQLYHAQGDQAKAGAQADALLKVARHPRDYIAAAQIRAKLDQRDAALAALDLGIAAAPDVTQYTFRARLLPKSDIAGRRAAIKAALALDEHANEALLLRGELEFDTGNYRSAIGTYNIALEDVTGAARNLPDLLIGRGAAYAQLGRLADAERDLGSARTGSKPMRLNHVCWYLATRNVALQTALNNCEQALAKEPLSPAILDSKGFVLLRLGRYHDAIAAYDAALTQQRDSASSLYGRGISKRRQGDLKGSDADIHAAQAIDANIASKFADYGIHS